MAKAISSVLGSKGSDGVGDGLFQREQVAGLGTAQQLFDLRPTLFNGVEVGGIGWQVAQLRFGSLDQFSDAIDFVSRQVVHHDNIAGLKLRAQHLFQIGQETSPSVGDSMVIVATHPDWRTAPNTVRVRQCPPGVPSHTRWPSKTRP